MDSIERRIQDAQRKKDRAEEKLALAMSSGDQEQIRAAQYDHICSIDNLQRVISRGERRNPKRLGI